VLPEAFVRWTEAFIYWLEVPAEVIDFVLLDFQVGVFQFQFLDCIMDSN
jgi:hypothetical protein